jgi:hypothetical protein
MDQIFGSDRSQMAREVTGQSKAVSTASPLALALGAIALGAVAIGALAIGRLVVGRIVIKKARFGALEVDELTVRKLRVVEHEGPISSWSRRLSGARGPTVQPSAHSAKMTRRAKARSLSSC